MRKKTQLAQPSLLSTALSHVQPAVRFHEKSSDGLPPGGASWGYVSSGEGTLCASQVEMSCHFLLCALTSVSRPRFVCVLLPVLASEQLLVICRVDYG